MKYLLALALIAMMLTGCDRHDAAPVIPQSESTGASVTEAVPEETRPATLLNGKQPVGENLNLWYVPNSQIEQMEYPQICISGNTLIIGSAFYDETYLNDSTDSTEDSGEEYGQTDDEWSTNEIVCKYRLHAVDLHDGMLVGEYAFDSTGYAQTQIWGNRICVIDSGIGVVKVLDDQLILLEEYQIDCPYGEWYLSPDLKMLYTFNWLTGLTRVNLETGEKTTMLPDAADTTCCCASGEKVVFSFVDRVSQKYIQMSLDISTGELQPVEWDFSVSVGSGNGETWILNDMSDPAFYHIVSRNRNQTVHYSGDCINMTMGKDQIYTMSGLFHNVLLYDSDGTFCSECHIPEQETAMSGSFVWSELWQGYFFITTASDWKSKLMFWDISQPMQGENLELSDYTNEIPGGYSVQPELYKRASEMSRRYGLDIRIADQCRLDYSDYYSYAIHDSYQITEALDTLEMALSHYPEGFFQQLCYGKIRSIQIEMIGGLVKKDIPPDAAFSSFIGFAQDMGSYYLIVVDVAETYPDTYYHEFSHIIDEKLAWDASYREGALFSENEWLELQPEGFDYAYSYTCLPDQIYNDRVSSYFIDDYSCTFPTEDRARVMEYAMSGWNLYFPDDGPLAQKLDYYSRCIRDSFDVTGWPEITSWEQPLHTAE